MTHTQAAEAISTRIHVMRGVRVLVDADLAALYGVTTRRLNQAVLRNRKRFPEDFCFRLTRGEVDGLRENQGEIMDQKSACENKQLIVFNKDADLKSQIVTSSCEEGGRGGSHGGSRKLPLVFTEHGSLMAAMILRSERAIQMSVAVVRAFVHLRQLAATHRALAAKLDQLEERVGRHDENLAEIVAAIRGLTMPEGPEHGRKIGFHSGNR